MARPRKGNNKRRSAFTGVWLTPAERATLDTKAQQTGLSFSEFVRRQMFNRKVVVVPYREQVVELVWLLGKVGTNLNQLMPIAHRTGQISDQITAAIVQVEEAAAKLVKMDLTHEPKTKSTRP